MDAKTRELALLAVLSFFCTGVAWIWDYVILGSIFFTLGGVAALGLARMSGRMSALMTFSIGGSYEVQPDSLRWRQPMSSAGTMAVPTLVLIEQFEVGENSITHKPTGWRFMAYQDSPTDGTIIRGRLGDKLETGEDFHPHEVEDMARRLWARHLEARKKQV